MADESAEEKQFDPTPRRLEEARQEGRVALSKDVNSAAQLMAGLLLIMFAGEYVMTWTCNGTAEILERLGDTGDHALSIRGASWLLAQSMGLPVLAVCCAAGLVAAGAGALQTGFNWAPKAMAVKFDRINPAQRFKDIFGFKKLTVNTLLSAGKIFAAGFIVWLILRDKIMAITALPLGTFEAAMALLVSEITELFLWVTLALAAIAAIDYAWQKYQLNDSLKMTREEMKRERIEEEGQPEIRGRRKQMHRELSMNRILEEVPQADVIVTNPTHFAVALRYRPGQDKAPMVTAKGADELAAHIRAIARQNGVPIIEHRPLARTLWRKVKVGRAVPSNLYQAVAEVLARVYRSRRKNTPQRPIARATAR